MSGNVFGIDLGTSNIKIYNHHEDAILDEKNIIAIEGRNNVYAIGDSAFEMFEKAPERINIGFPIVNGVIANIDNMQILFKKMLEKSIFF